MSRDESRNYAAAYAPADGLWISDSADPPRLVNRAADKVKSDEPELWIRLLRAPKLIDQIRSDWAFRGHPNEQWPLLSALSRYLMNFRVDPPVWAAQEERILRIFKRKGHHFLSGRPLPDDDFEWLALMQHHGAPTRLLDFTWSPYVAAFFALQLATGDAAVWALNPARISKPEAVKIGVPYGWLAAPS